MMAQAPDANPHYASACTRVGDYEVTYLEAGTGPETVVLLHGFGAWSEVAWGQTIPALSDRYRVIAPDLIGFGLSAKPSPEILAEDPLRAECDFLRNFLDVIGVEQATVVGNSFGGGLAIRFARENPDRVDKLGLVCSMGLGRSIHPVYKALAIPLLGPTLAKPNHDRLWRMWRWIIHDQGLITDEIVERNFELLSMPGATEMLLAARTGVNLIGQKIRLENDLHLIAHPTLVVWGKHDRIFPLRHARRAIHRLPNGRLEVLECGHLPPFECPGEFNAVLRRFLDGPPHPPAPLAHLHAHPGDAPAVG